MARDIFNTRKLGDAGTRAFRFSAFVDGYIQSLDLYPECYRPKQKKPINALWEDFVRISADAESVIEKNIDKDVVKKTL